MEKLFFAGTETNNNNNNIKYNRCVQCFVANHSTVHSQRASREPRKLLMFQMKIRMECFAEIQPHSAQCSMLSAQRFEANQHFHILKIYFVSC